MAAVGQLLDGAVRGRDPPQLVGAVLRREERQPAAVADGISREPSPGVMSLFMLEPGMRSCRADMFRPPFGVASLPSAANSQMSLR